MWGWVYTIDQYRDDAGTRSFQGRWAHTSWKGLAGALFSRRGLAMIDRDRGRGCGDHRDRADGDHRITVKIDETVKNDRFCGYFQLTKKYLNF